MASFNELDKFAESKNAKKRRKIIDEIIHTEITYQHHLQLLITFFEEPLRKLGILPVDAVAAIFSNIKQIININKELSSYLEVDSIGKAFLKLAPFLKLYSTYANNHERALGTLLEWDQKSAEFSEFRRSQEECAPLDGLKLNALLVTPVQRIPRYRLLLEELKQVMDDDDPELDNLTEALKQITKVASHINEHIKQQDNFMKMLAIQRSLGDHGAPKILVPGRIFVREGVLKKVSKNGAASHDRTFFLFSDILMYGKTRSTDHAGIRNFHCCCILPLQHCKVQRVFGQSSGDGVLFSITCKEETILLYSERDNADAWIDSLNSAIGALTASRQTLRRKSSECAPLRHAAISKAARQERISDREAVRRSIRLKRPLSAISSSSREFSPDISTTSETDQSSPCFSPKRGGSSNVAFEDSPCSTLDSEYRPEGQLYDDSLLDESPPTAPPGGLGCLSPEAQRRCAQKHKVCPSPDKTPTPQKVTLRPKARRSASLSVVEGIRRTRHSRLYRRTLKEEPLLDSSTTSTCSMPANRSVALSTTSRSAANEKQENQSTLKRQWSFSKTWEHVGTGAKFIYNTTTQHACSIQ